MLHVSDFKCSDYWETVNTMNEKIYFFKEIVVLHRWGNEVRKFDIKLVDKNQIASPCPSSGRNDSIVVTLTEFK